MSFFAGLHIGLSALQAQQVKQETIGQNVANVNTPGYSRRRVHLVAVPGDTIHAVAPRPGMGVQVADISRAASALLNRQIERETGGMAYWQALKDGMSQVEGMYQELSEDGLSSLTDTLWAAWHTLSTDPTSSAARLGVRQSADTLASNIRQIYGEVSRYATQLDDALNGQAQQINSVAEQIAGLNVQIGQAAGRNDPANELKDQRDLLLGDLSKMADIHTIETESGLALVSVGGHLLVGASGANQMQMTTREDGVRQVTWSDDGSAVTPSGGELAATLKLRDWTRTQVMGGLDRYAAQLIDSVNTLHRAAYTADGRTGLDFFAGAGAGDIRVSDVVAGDLSAIATAQAGNTPGDGSAALGIADLQKTRLDALGDTLGGYFATYQAQIGLDVQKADGMAKNQEALVNLLDGRREQLSGVSLDEEAVELLSTQRAYQAATRLITAVDDMLDRIINGMGEVGR